eukprot:gene37907-46052_t
MSYSSFKTYSQPVCAASVFIATTLDGFIARKNGDIDWLDKANEKVPAGEDCGYQEFMDSVDALVMGRNTFEKVLTFGDWPYASKPVHVLSSQKALAIPESLHDKVFHTNDAPHELLKRLTAEGHKRVYVDGGRTIQSFIRCGLISDFTITIIPILLGEGISLFDKLDKEVPLKLLDRN